MPAELDNPMLVREFESTDANGNTVVIKLLIGKPYLDSESEWRCPYQVIGVGFEKIREGRGVDALDALLVSLRMVDTFLKVYAHYKITWLGQEDLGLSLSPPRELTDEERSVFDPDDLFEKTFNDFFIEYGKQHKKSLPPDE